MRFFFLKIPLLSCDVGPEDTLGSLKHFFIALTKINFNAVLLHCALWRKYTVEIVKITIRAISKIRKQQKYCTDR